MKKFIYLIVAAFAFASCTDNFEEINTNPYQISTESLKQDFNHVGSFYPSMLGQIFGNQIDHNLTNVTFSQQLATPTPFVGGVNNTTYYIRWNGYWDREYNNVMAPAKQVIEIAEADGYSVFVEWANLIKIISMSRVTLYQGPIIYTNYGKTGGVQYDSEEVLYKAFFSDLDRIIAEFSNNKDYVGLNNFDASFNGDVNKWARYANSLRLQLAMRVSKVDPELAKKEGEKALADPAGLMLSNADNFNISGYGAKFHPAQICFEWGDTRMSASMESILIGYKDNRIEKYFDPVSDMSLVSDHPDWPYKGIRNGAEMVAKDDRLGFSTLDISFNDPAKVTKRKVMSADEVYFLKAEAALRGWTGAGDAQSNYESGVRASFELWGAGGVDAYLADKTSLPLDYVDPKAPAGVNAFTNSITNTVAWDEAATKEEKLEKIITQKWIACFTNEMESWMDHRRTGYPKLPIVYQNSSNADWGTIPQGDILRRMPFVNNERNGNPEGVADATVKLKGPDEIGTRLWWDTGGSNF
ncbi:SusD/RagB family nutrient-binding outer membrane lipoprotein [Arcticibacterium luteifluviistationis]|uniref:SusD/RagB family nutrient-binding outer membrane lipoprotein n=1 Tax=Arcticibacterium luteifluviistationis TaxID=1784714 RepID=A0A2Z4GHA1_9BACT|nr:SusD/RagB family nutrient-binding outer membrane lipoprotein [Arcticibacterium luteifluviistationis]AWW00700.1 SusD/RagB family nutrient-binding outer membrane lipoprotein [Arcticibacterium luteifluviistationis]